MRHLLIPLCTAALALTTALPSPAESNIVEPPLSTSERDKVLAPFRQLLKSTPAPDDQQPDAVAIHSRRGDAFFFLAEFHKAVAEYQAMVTLQPDLDASHWRLGIALFFADRPEEAAEQFDRYHAFDDVDRENGIWRFLSHYRAFGAERAAKELLRYSKDDREPFPMVYRLFEGGVTPEHALQQIPDALPATELDKRLFYTELYTGFLKTVQGAPDAALPALRNATARRWPRTAGFGPHYMWHVGRLQYELLVEKAGQTDQPQNRPQ